MEMSFENSDLDICTGITNHIPSVKVLAGSKVLAYALFLIKRTFC